MKYQREILPSGPSVASSVSSGRDLTPQSVTRAASSAPRRHPLTKIACTFCRRRKSKCNGHCPVCSMCASMGCAMCKYDGGPDVTRFAALKTKHEELQHRITLFEEFFHLLSMRSEAESVEIIGRMRIANIETDLEDLVKFIKNADLLVQMASAQSDQTPPASGEPSVDTQLPIVPLDYVSLLLELLKPAVSKLDASAQTALLDMIRHVLDAFASREGSRSGFAETVKPDGEAHDTERHTQR
ncbi:C6 transcription factor [Colletotrichum higginsianum IMI 349063]|uniref:C6 transcription factor n=3 Tax=Colletotrichum higginsianum TaxID=80884 RepID=A0A1B7Y364_COLHI|nr:C6 transcription factor [Colletotrichum higginsianum IMI 349063]OBR06470.1 C6 transcription factor [Colletotrichum higginsianum IMI 349063]